MFHLVTLSTYNYDALLIGWSAQVLKQDVRLGAGESRYCSDAAIASEQLGVNYNELTDDKVIEKLCGNAALNGVPVEVRKAS